MPVELSSFSTRLVDNWSCPPTESVAGKGRREGVHCARLEVRGRAEAWRPLPLLGPAQSRCMHRDCFSSTCWWIQPQTACPRETARCGRVQRLAGQCRRYTAASDDRLRGSTRPDSPIRSVLGGVGAHIKHLAGRTCRGIRLSGNRNSRNSSELRPVSAPSQQSDGAWPVSRAPVAQEPQACPGYEQKTLRNWHFQNGQLAPSAPARRAPTAAQHSSC